MSWLDITGIVAGLLVSGVLLAVLDPSLARRWLSRIGGHGPRGS